MKTTPFTLETTSQVLIRCFWIGVAVLFLGFGGFLAAGQVAYEIHEQWFSLTRHEFDLLMYGSLGLLKVFLFVGFLIPYIAIRLVLARQESVAS